MLNEDSVSERRDERVVRSSGRDESDDDDDDGGSGIFEGEAAGSGFRLIPDFA